MDGRVSAAIFAVKVSVGLLCQSDSSGLGSMAVTVRLFSLELSDLDYA